MSSSDGNNGNDIRSKIKDGKKKINFFLVFLICWLVVITGFIAWFLLRFNDFAANYEAQYQESMPYHTVEQITQHFNDHDVEYIWNSMDQKPVVTEFEDESVVKDYIAQLISDKQFIYSETEHSEPNVPEFYVKTSEGLVVARIVLEEDTSKNLPYGFKAWKDRNIEFYTAASTQANIYAPETYKVYVNGIELKASHLSGAVAPSELDKYVEPYAKIPGTANYVIKGLYKKPVVTAKDYLGNDCSCVYDEKTDSYRVGFIKDFAEKDELSEYAITFASTFANYISQDAGAYALDKYFPSGSKTLSYIKRNSSRDLYTKHGKVTLKNGQIKDITVFTDDIVYMEVYVEQHMQMYFGSKAPEVVPTDAHVYFVRIKGKWYVGGIQY
jgi:hypothetical protein